MRTKGLSCVETENSIWGYWGLGNKGRLPETVSRENPNLPGKLAQSSWVKLKLVSSFWENGKKWLGREAGSQ